PLLERKALLQALLADAAGPLAFSSHVEGHGEEAFRQAADGGFEGIISKRGDRPYQGGRGDDWRKTKELASDEFAVVGYTAPKGSRSGFGSLLLARPDPGHGWRYVGRVGSGFSDERMREVTAALGKRGGKAATAHVGTTDTDLRTATWFKPRFVVEVFYRGIGRQGLLRQPSLKAVRMDKDVADLMDSDRGGGGAGVDKGKGSREGAKRAKKAKATGSKRGKAAVGVAATPPTERELPELSSPAKVMLPDIRATKQDVWDYYLTVSDHLLPEIAGRPLSVIRCPSGAGKS